MRLDARSWKSFFSCVVHDLDIGIFLEWQYVAPIGLYSISKTHDRKSIY